MRGRELADDALCDAKTAEQQTSLILVSMRARLITRRTQLSNAIRGLGAEFGVTAAASLCRIEPLLDDIAADQSASELAHKLFALHAKEFAALTGEIRLLEKKLMIWHRSDECSQWLAKIPGLGPIGAPLLVMKTPDSQLF